MKTIIIFVIFIFVIICSKEYNRKSSEDKNMYNFCTEQLEVLDLNNCSCYVPQDPASTGLYNTYIALGKSPIEATVEVLSFYISLRKENENE